MLEVEFSALREEVIELPDGVLLINDCYNANPISMRAALAHLADRSAGRRRVAVLGGMAELGAGAAAFHREVGALAAEPGVSELVTVGRARVASTGRPRPASPCATPRPPARRPTCCASFFARGTSSS